MSYRTNRRSTSVVNRHGRSDFGASLILLGGVIALVIIPVIGLFAFETNRYQFLQQSLSKACDAAALAGGAKLIAAETNTAATDSLERRKQKQLQAIAAAIEFMKKQQIAGVDINGAALDRADQGPLDSNGLAANKFRIAVYPADPANNYAKVALGAIEGTAVKVDACFMEVPTFVQHAGIQKVPVFASASSGSPRLEIVLCLDLSGSMDDSTRISLVRKLIKITAAGQQAVESLPPKPPFLPGAPLPSEEDLGDDIRNQCGEPSTSDDPNDPGYNPGYDACRQGVIDQACQAYNQAKSTYDSALAALNLPDYMYWHYNVVAAGQLRRILEDGGAQVADSGTQVNALPHRHLQYLGEQYTGKNFKYPPVADQTPPGNCIPGIGFTDLVVNLDSKVSLPADQYIQPTFNVNGYSTDVFSQALNDTSGFSFVNIADLVEGAKGTASATAAWGTGKILTNTQAEWPGVQFGGQAKKAAYEKDARNYLQPAATVIDAAKAFIDALADSGRNVKLGLTGYDTQCFDSEALPEDSNSSDNNIENKNFVPVNDEGIIREIPMVGLVPLSNPAAVTVLKTELDKMFSLRTTNMDAALQESRDLLEKWGAPGRGVKRAIVLFSDGQFSEDSTPPFATASTCKAKKIAINTIGLAQNVGLQTPMQNTLSQITNNAGNGGIFLSAPSASEVKKAFLLLARRMVKLQQ